MAKKEHTPAEEEAIARKRAAALEKARAARAANSEKKIASAIWLILKPRIDGHCKCNLRKGMNLSQLRELGAGCTDPHDYQHKVLGKPLPKFKSEKDRKANDLAILSQGSGYVCPVLDSYRRYLERPQSLYEKAAA